MRVDGSIQRDAAQVLCWCVVSRQLCWLRRMGSVGVRCYGGDSLSSLVDEFSRILRISMFPTDLDGAAHEDQRRRLRTSKL